MTSYALLLQPSANRVYADASRALSLAELRLLNASLLEDRLGRVEPVDLAGVGYLGFECEPDPAVLDEVANLSCAWALYERDGQALRPVALRPLAVLDDDLLTILKYRGKTNELFTRLLVNLTAWTAGIGARPRPHRVRLLDPLCGRGTTLNQALMYGWHAWGLDQDERDVEAYAAFLRTWLRTKRLKHTARTTRLRREGRTLGERFDARIGLDKESWTAGVALEVGVAAADTTHALAVFGAASADLVVTDAPYGVQHGSTAGSGLRRDPLDLLREAVPVWREVLRPGGAMGIAWNTLVADRADLVALLASAGLEPQDSGAWLDLAHRVDQGIVRDLVVARRPL